MNAYTYIMGTSIKLGNFNILNNFTKETFVIGKCNQDESNNLLYN